MNVIAIELGFGTSSYATRLNSDGKPDVKTFVSVVAQVDPKVDLSSGMGTRNTVQISFQNGMTFEVGPEAHLASGKSAGRILNNDYMDSEEYKALFYGCLVLAANSPGGSTEVDVLVLGVPVTSLYRADELKSWAVGEHKIGQKTINVKNVWVIVQPLGGLLSYADSLGQDGFERFKDMNTLCIDVGFGTVDSLYSRGLKVNASRSTAVEFGQGVLLTEIWNRALKPAFPRADSVPIDLIDAAFWRNSGKLTISGRSYPFPLCEGLDSDGEETQVRYDATPVIESVTNQAITPIKNQAGSGFDIDNILLFGGPAKNYLSAVKRAYPDHRIIVLPNHLTAVCEGMFLGGLQYAKKLKGK